MSKPDSNKPVTVEKLIQWKRHEKPSEEFWSDFEGEFQRRRLRHLLNRVPLRERLRSWLRPAILGMATVGSMAVLSMVFVQDALTRGAGSAGYTSIASESDPLPTVESYQNRIVEIASVAPARSNVQLQDKDTTALAESAHRFIMDAMSAESASPANYRRILYTPAMTSGAMSGSNVSRYVADPIRSADESQARLTRYTGGFQF